MSDKTRIEWTDATWNPVRGCSLVSDACRHCYAMHVAARFSGPGLPYEGLTMKTSQGPKWTGAIKLVPGMLEQPLRWTRPRRIFVNSMSDLFHDDVPDSFIDRVFAVMALCPQHTFQILTKRPERMRDYVKTVLQERSVRRLARAAEEFRRGGLHTPEWLRFHAYQPGLVDSPPIPNVWLGVSVEDQKTADERIPLLVQTPAAVRWLSMEPLLGPVNLCATPAGDILCRCDGCMTLTRGTRIDWVVVGGESGPGARPMHPAWVLDLRDQCKVNGVPFLFKQWGEWAPAHDSMRLPIKKWLEFPERETDARNVRFHGDAAAERVQLVGRVGKKMAGRMLDGRTWDEYPVTHRSDVCNGPTKAGKAV